MENVLRCEPETKALVCTRVDDDDTIKLLITESSKHNQFYIEILYLFKTRSESNFTIVANKLKEDVLKYISEKCECISIVSEIKDPKPLKKTLIIQSKKEDSE